MAAAIPCHQVPPPLILCHLPFLFLKYLIILTGLTHGEIERQLFEAKKRKFSVKDIVLKVDSMTSCKICAMVYSDHMMGKPEIRRHLFTEHGLQNDILQKVQKQGRRNWGC